MDEESCGIRSEDDKNKKRIVKTRAQVNALEKFYIEHKYPTDTMKIQLAESIGLTEKQVAGWFCHRRLKDKRLLNGETCTIGRQDRSSGIIQDLGSGLRQDSCGSTKQGDDRTFDTREVESGRFNLRELSTTDITCERGSQFMGNNNPMNDTTSGSSSSLPKMSSHHLGDPLNVATSRYVTPKFPVEVKGVKARSGPSGYLKVKGQAENSAITAVKMQLGRHYREDGPPLGIEFDPLPPGAFESPMQQNPVDEPYYSGEPVLPASTDIPKIRQYPMFDKSSQELEYNSGMTSYNVNMDRAKTMHVSHSPDSYLRKKFGKQTSFSESGAYNPRNNFSMELPESSAKYMSSCNGGDDYRMRSRQGVDVVRNRSSINGFHMQPYGGKMEGGRAESWARRSGDDATKLSQRDVKKEPYHGDVKKGPYCGDVKIDPHYGDVKEEAYYMAKKGNKYHNVADKGVSQRIIEDDNFYGERRVMNENCEPIPVKIPFRNEPAPKRMRDEFPHQQYQRRVVPVDNQRLTSHVMRSRTEMTSSFSEDEGIAETSSSVE